jgi:hypothetical protein
LDLIRKNQASGVKDKFEKLTQNAETKRLLKIKEGGMYKDKEQKHYLTMKFF